MIDEECGKFQMFQMLDVFERTNFYAITLKLVSMHVKQHNGCRKKSHVRFTLHSLIRAHTHATPTNQPVSHLKRQKHI